MSSFNHFIQQDFVADTNLIMIINEKPDVHDKAKLLNTFDVEAGSSCSRSEFRKSIPSLVYSESPQDNSTF